MKRDVLAMGLVGVLLAGTLVTVGLCYLYLKTAQEVRYMQTGLNDVTRRRQAVQALAIDLNEYAKRNRAIIPLLEELNLRPRLATNVVGSTNAARGGQP